MENETIEEGLEAIYRGEEKVDFTKIERKQNRLTTMLLTVVITLAIVAGVSWGAFLVYNRYFAQEEEKTFSIAIDVEKKIISGEKTNITIRYGNPNEVPITGLELDVRVPDSFHVESISPTPENIEDQIWSIGNIASGSSGLIIIEGIWTAEVPSSIPVQVLANYRPANFNSDFQEIETVYVQTLDSYLDIALNGPTEAQSGDLIEYEVTVENTGPAVFKDTYLQLNLPNGFFLDSSNPTLTPGENTKWMFEAIEPGETIDVNFSGTFAGDVNGFQYFDIILGIEQEEGQLVQRSERGLTDLMGSELKTQLIVNGGIDNVNISTDDNLRISATIENDGKIPREDIELLLKIESENPLPINWDSAKLDNGTITADGIYWPSSEIGTLEPGDRALINITIPITSSVGNGQADRFTLIASTTQNQNTVKSSPITVSVLSDAQITTSARYFTEEGTPIGSGPLPPTVDETTAYRIYWTIENSLHDLEDITVSTTLPPNVIWEETTSAELGKFSYRTETETVEWNIDKLPKDITRLEGYFTVSITPTASDIGKFVKLTSSSTLEATDSFAESDVTNESESTTTELVDDEFALGQSIVVEAEE